MKEMSQVSPKRKPPSLDVKKLVQHEAGYKCSNPVCRTILTLDIHHLVPVAKKGDNSPDNLLALCPNCHALHHRNKIPEESLRAWKMLLLSLNEAFDRRSIDLLLALDRVGRLYVSGDGVLGCASLIAADLVSITEGRKGEKATYHNDSHIIYTIELTNKGKQVVDGWKRGDQRAATQSVV